MRYFLVFLFSSFLLISCKDDDTQTPEIMVDDLEIATGVVLTDENGQGIGSVGNPNWYNGLILYPNPPSEIQTAALQSGKLITGIEVVPAEKNTDFTATEVSEIFLNFEGYPIEEVKSKAEKSISILTNIQPVSYQLDGLSPGYYRIIVTDEDEVQHGSTIYIDSTLSYPTALRDFLFSDWP